VQPAAGRDDLFRLLRPAQRVAGPEQRLEGFRRGRDIGHLDGVRPQPFHADVQLAHRPQIRPVHRLQGEEAGIDHALQQGGQRLRVDPAFQQAARRAPGLRGGFRRPHPAHPPVAKNRAGRHAGGEIGVRERHAEAIAAEQDDGRALIPAVGRRRGRGSRGNLRARKPVAGAQQEQRQQAGEAQTAAGHGAPGAAGWRPGTSTTSR